MQFFSTIKYDLEEEEIESYFLLVVKSCKADRGHILRESGRVRHGQTSSKRTTKDVRCTLFSMVCLSEIPKGHNFAKDNSEDPRQDSYHKEKKLQSLRSHNWANLINLKRRLFKIMFT